MALLKGHTFEDGETVTAAKLNNLVDLATVGTDTITTGMIVDANVTANKLATDAVTGAKIKSNTVNLNSLVNATGSTQGTILQSGSSGVWEELEPHATAGLPLKSAGTNSPLVFGALDNVGVGANLISGHTEDTTPAKDDVILTKDASAGANKKVQLQNVFKTISGLSSLTSATVSDTDEFVVLDASDSTPKRIAHSDIQAGASLPTASGEYYTSDSAAISTLGTDTSFTHGLGSAPKLVRVSLVCTSTELGYAAGDELDFATGVLVSGDYQPIGAIYHNSTTIYVTFPYTIQVYDVSGTADNPTVPEDIDRTKWTIRVRAWK